MRSNALFSLPVLTGVWLVGCSCNNNNNITPQEPDEVFNDIGSWLGLDALADGSPAVSYYDRTKGGLGFAIGTLEDDSIRWKVEEIDGYPDENGLDPGDRGTHTDLAIDGDGTAWIAYRDETNRSLRYAKRAADGTWETGMGGTGSGASPDVGLWSSLELDASDNPVIAYYDKGGEALRISHYSDGSFSNEVIDEGGVGTYADLLIRDGVEYIAYYDATNGDLKLAVGTPGSYAIEVVDAEGDVGKWPSINHKDGSFHIAYQDAANNDLLVATGTPGSWTTELVDDGDYRGSDNELVYIGNAPAVYSFDGYNNDLMLAEQTPGTWEIGTVAGEESALGFHVEAINVGNDIYVASYDYTNRFLFFAIY